MTETIPDTVRRLVRKHKTLRGAARATGVDAAYLLRLRDGKKTNPGPKVLDQLGIKRVSKLVRLPDEP